VEGKFRPDLYYRLGVFTIHLPPLRERGNDLVMLVEHYLRRFNRELGRNVRELAPEALERLRSYSWPGNIRELESVLKQALLQASGPALLPTFLPEPLQGIRGQESGMRDQKSGSGSSLTPGSCRLTPGGEPDPEAFIIRQRLRSDVRDLYADVHRQLDRLLLPRVLEYTGGSQHQAALLLGIARQTLRLKLRDLGLAVTRTVEAEEDPG
jgi:two-component system nitrogen regulation response regulator GlnG